ncbi:leucyl/phenylalanyl-tRNA--protein transferase [Patiriisocius marinistellae]|uniref:Leucyl/phenylalanyl-tRNA--protein transferase n=1 Tax=Patiriisocius marinistellae TaxID=2494560 RepID=A0A5J4FWW1_9FLAO|nr:leucyl/phenylalanyl-tRNA--protein transferase [Patiriisocius marinistellae]GEQ84596.1 leucyl/phenylalanyl-tRNA--protein transferase [Patiriisocius marinistellae]
MYLIDNIFWFPHPSQANEDGILAVGGDLTMERLLLAYNSGIFPWYEDNQPILWWSPDPRMVLLPSEMRITKSLKRTIKKEVFKVTFNTAFPEVIKNCATIKRDGQGGTWITNAMKNAYINLHKNGKAMSIEVWQDDELVGGLYGVDLKDKKVFCGESMFSRVSDASKVGFYYLAQYLIEKDYKIIDCQVYNEHLESLGAYEISRKEFLTYLNGE